MVTMKISFIVFLCYLAIINTKLFSSTDVNSNTTTITLPVETISYFDRNQHGDYAQVNGVPFHGKKERYTFKTVLSSRDTALLVIDPWVNMPDTELNHSNQNIIDEYLIPLIIKASQHGFPVYVFTQDCKRMTKEYSCSVPQKISSLQHQYPRIKIYYWDDYDNSSKTKQLFTESGIRNLIYTGFSSNMCIINRPAGMIAMMLQGFSNYFIPEASSAIEIESTKKDKGIHKAMEIVIAQSLGKIIHYNQIVSALDKSS